MEQKPSLHPISAVGSAVPSTTFVQADASTFRDVVQKLTGATGGSVEKLPVTAPARHATRGAASCSDAGGPRRSAFKLHERRHSVRKLEVKLGVASLQGGRSQPPISSISSPVTPLGSGPIFSGQLSASRSGSPISSSAASEEERAIAGKGFYFHPSPLSTPRGAEPPELLPLFPLHSPRLSD